MSVWTPSPDLLLCQVSWRCSEWGRRVRLWVAPGSRYAEPGPIGRKALAQASHLGGLVDAGGLHRPGQPCCLVQK